MKTYRVKCDNFPTGRDENYVLFRCQRLTYFLNSDLRDLKRLANKQIC